MSESVGSTARAWMAFYAEHRRAMASYALSLTGQVQDAEDLVQETLVRMVQLDQPVHHAKAFVFKSMRHLAIDRRRAAGRRPTMGTLDGIDATFIDTDLDDLVRRETARSVQRAMEALSPGQAEVVLLRVYAGLSFREIAAVLDRPMGTVTSEYARSLQRLQKILEKGTSHV
ncbi:MAG: RNA polymerase sigma factor [Phycisphaerae bacterium]|nr:RNA polymerase sigma factor [Phycisphaerae bacterium]